jgi:WD40 repeat protein
VALSADGRWVVSSADDNSVRVWDLTAAEIAATVDCGAPVYCCAIADNNTIVAGDKKGNVHFLQLEIRPQK